MDQLERALRELLTDDKLSLPTRPGAVAAVHDGVRRRRRRRTAAAVTSIATVVAGSVTGITLLTTAGTRAEPPTKLPPSPNLSYDVPWVNRITPPLWSPAPIAAKLPTLNAAPCRADQLAVVQKTHQNGTGSELWFILLRNISNKPCKLIGSPMEVVATEPGQPDVVGSRGLSIGHGGVGGDLQPGKEGYLTVETSRSCPQWQSTKAPLYYTLVVTLPSATAITAHMPLNVVCGLHNGGLGVLQPPTRYPPDPRRVLEAGLSVPANVHAGKTLDYVVTLTNPTARAVSLRHCPGYVESGTFADATPIKAVFGLNCTSVGSIAAGKSVRFQMRLHIPADAPAGLLNLSWQLVIGKPGTYPTTMASVPVLAAG